MLSSILKKILFMIDKKINNVFKLRKSKQEKYLESFKAPNNNLERSFNQYLCQKKINGKLISFLFNILSLPVLCYEYMKLENNIVSNVHYDAVFVALGLESNLIPDSLQEEFGDILIANKYKHNFDITDRKFFINILRKYPFSWYFALKCLYKIKMYSYFINNYDITAIIGCNEFSFTSSVLTEYCKQKQIEHINIMHGEKLYYIRDSFFKFDRYYIWDSYYKNLLTNLKADNNQFIVEIPKFLNYVETNQKKEYDFTYYLANETVKELYIIRRCVHQLIQKGYNVCVRPHPRYSNNKEVMKIFNEIEIENNKCIDIESSLKKTSNAISLFSTVLNQAYYWDINIVIDDISNPNKFEILKDLEYICITKEHDVLSRYIEEDKCF